jgi:NADH dehydrogenase
LQGRTLPPFRYFDKGILAVIGRGSAVADIAGVRLGGLLAWMTWCFVHIFYLIGFRNRFVVMFEWAWAYATYQRGARLITGNIDAYLERKR